MKKKLIIRTSLIVLLIILGIILFVIGKQHKVLLDNRDLTIDGVTYTAEAAYEIWVDGEKVGRTALNPGRRNVAYVVGPSHEIELREVKNGKPTGDSIVKKFRLSVKQSEVIINIPALAAGSDSFLYEAD
ncbi:MAG: DUF6672 family protein [Halanaerobiales bacterium]|jgi:hypothetical protein